MLRLTKTVCFAEEMTRACLAKPLFFTERGLNKVWDSMEAKVLDTDNQVVSLRIRVRGFSRVVYATCHVLMRREGCYDMGQCRIELRGNDSYNEAYWCACVNDEMRYWGLSLPVTAFGVDDDIAADLTRAGILTWIELSVLSEIQVAQILLPTPETDAYVLTHPDLGHYLPEATFDKLERLRPTLDRMGVVLSGSPLSRCELAALL